MREQEEARRFQGYRDNRWQLGGRLIMSSTHLDGRTFKEASVPRANLTNCTRTVGTSLSPKCRSQAAWQRWGRQEAKTSFQRPARAALESVQAWSCLSPQWRGTLTDAGGLGTVASPLV